MFDDLKKLVQEKATIDIRGHKEEVRKLTVSEIEHYQDIVNKGIGKVKADIARQETQQALLDLERLGNKQSEADRYLIKRSFSEKGEPDSINDEDIDELYDVYTELVQQLHIVNGINVVDENTEEKIKK